MARKTKESSVEPSVEVPLTPAPTELECKLAEQAALLALREKLTNLGIDSLSKLDNLLGAVNQRVKELS